MAEKLRENKVFADCNIFIDSFTSFTGEEYAIIEQIIRQAKNVCVSLAYDKKSSAPHFVSVERTYEKISAYAELHGIEINETVLSKKQECNNRELCALEKNLWNFSVTSETLPQIQEEERGHIEMYSANNEFEEVYLAALNILSERQRGLDYSEIAVILRDAESRKGMIDAVFEEFGIPYFLSERTDLSATAPARLILSVLRCIAHNYNSSDVITLLKTGLLNIDERDADLFEDYCYTWKISGNLFTADAWSMNPDGYTPAPPSERALEILESANRVRLAIIPPIQKLKTRFSINKGNTQENCRALYDYLEEISLAENLSKNAEFALSMGDIKGAGEIIRLYDCIVSTLTDISSILGESITTADELCSAMEIMLKNTDIGSVPGINDCVTVGSASTLRIENVKTAILMGLCEGEFPANYTESSIFSENDKQKMDSLGIKLSSREKTVVSDELFFVYRAMAKPKEKLILSTCRASVSGRALNPSSAWNRVHFLFPYIMSHDFDGALVRALADKKQQGVKIEKTEDPPASADEIFETNEIAEIDPLFVRMIFGDRLSLSKSRISTFAGCPYRYWCEYVLKLREQKISSISFADSGTIIHHVLEHALKALHTESGKLKKVSDSELAELVNGLVEDFVSSISCPLPPSVMYSISRLRDMALIMVKSVTDEFNTSSFRILAFEKPISDRAPDALKPMEIKVDESENSPVVCLGGVIDRIDCFEGKNRRYVRIIDYKTGAHKYDVTRITTGEDLQLPAYLFTATIDENREFFGNTEKELFPASALFLSAEESDGSVSSVRSGFTLNDSELIDAVSPTHDPHILGMRLKKDGTPYSGSDFSEEAILNINTVMRETISGTARNMYSGKAPRTPSRESCGFCSLKATCPVANKEK